MRLSTTNSSLTILLLVLMLLLVRFSSTNASSSATYSPGVRVGDWWNYAGFGGRCQSPCPPGFQATLNITEATAIVTGEPNSTAIKVKNTVAFNNQTVKTYTTMGDLASGTGNLSFVSSMLISGHLAEGDPIFNLPGAPMINGTKAENIAGANRTVNILNDTQTHRVFYWDQATGVLVQFSLFQPNVELYYHLTGTSLWSFRVAITDGNCEPISPVSCGFTPLQITIITGTNVTWKNTGTLLHAIDSCTLSNNPPPSPLACSLLDQPFQPSFASGNIPSNFTWSFTFPVPGQFYYYDPNNPNMKGSVTVLGNATAPPGFTMKVQPNPIKIPEGRNGIVNIGIHPTNGYTGPVTLSSIFPTGPNYPTSDGPSGTSFFYGGSGNSSTAFAVSTSLDTPEGIYTALMIAYGNGLTRTVTLEINVTSPTANFYLTSSQDSLDIVEGSSATVPILLHSIIGYSGPVLLSTSSNSPGNLYPTVNPASLTLAPNQTSTATLSVYGAVPGNYTATVTGNNQNRTLYNSVTIAVHIHRQIGLLLYEVAYLGDPYPGNNIKLVNRFANLGNVPDLIIAGTITIDFGIFPFDPYPSIMLQPGETSSLNLTVTIPETASLGNHTVTATLNWQAMLNGYWAQAPPLSIHGELPVETAPPPPPPPPPPSAIQGTTTRVSALMSQLVTLAKNYGLWLAAIYIPSVVAVTYLTIRQEKRKNKQA